MTSKINWNHFKILALILLSNLFTFVFVSALWAIDIGSSALASGGTVIGLFGERSGNEHYHMGLVGAGVAFFALITLLAFISALYLSNNKVEK